MISTIGRAHRTPSRNREECMRKLVLGLVLAGFAGLAGIAPASAEPYPSRPITMIIPFPAGGITDIVARIVSERMRTALGQPVVAENVSGAGYTIGIGQWTSNVGSGAMYNLPFDLLTDLQPISLVSFGPLWIIGRKDLPAGNLKELIAWLKSNPKATAATIGVGSGAHMCLI